MTDIETPPIPDPPDWVGGSDLYAHVVEASPDPIYFCTPDYVIRATNSHYAKMGGQNRHGAIGRKVSDIIGTPLFHVRRSFLDRAMAGETISFSTWVEMPHTGRRFHNVTYQPVHNDDGLLIGVAAYGRDVTDLKRAEETLRMYKSVISQMSDRISIVDRSFRYRMTNESNARWHGLLPKDFVGLPVSEVVGESHFESHVRPMLKDCFGGKTMEYDFKATAPEDGRPVVIGARLEPFRNAEGAIEAAVVTLRDMTEARQLAERYEKLALADDLTGLANRRAFEGWIEKRLEWLSGSTSEVQGFNLVFVDLDDFKIVNDTVGHGAGDRFLQGIADKLRIFAGENVSVARIGGDEFGILIDASLPEPARALCAEVLNALNGFHFVWDHMTFRGGASLGLATVSREMAQSSTTQVSDVLKWADQACMRAKAAGGRQMMEFVPDEKGAAARREEVHHLALVERALSQTGLLSLQRMPIADVSTLETRMHEVLLRLEMPDGSLQGPSMILATAERHGLMRDVDRWMIDAVLDQLERTPAELPVAVNLSHDSLGHRGFAKDLIKRLSASPETASMLAIEISETSMTRVDPSAWACLAELRQLGCKIVLDDFGKGFSSYAHLREGVFDMIKIDRVLTAGARDDPVKRAAISGVVGLSDALGLPTIAEYVEDETCFAPLAELGVRYAQGHFIGRPEQWGG